MHLAVRENDPSLIRWAGLRFVAQELWIESLANGAALQKQRADRADLTAAADKMGRLLVSTFFGDDLTPDVLADLGRQAWGELSLWRRLKGYVAGPSATDTEDVVARVKELMGDYSVSGEGAQRAYGSFALVVGQAAGQTALSVLGMGETWRFTSPRDLAAEITSVRGSKIIQNAAGQHLDELSRIVSRATNPATPRTISQVTKEIRGEWGTLTRRQAQRIARTETANLWVRTQWHTYKANGIQRVRWITGAANVCPICLANASQEWVPIDENFDSGDGYPPAHPNCACDLVPETQGWLPPAEPFTGQGTNYPVAPSSGPTGPLANPVPQQHLWRSFDTYDEADAWADEVFGASDLDSMSCDIGFQFTRRAWSATWKAGIKINVCYTDDELKAMKSLRGGRSARLNDKLIKNQKLTANDKALVQATDAAVSKTVLPEAVVVRRAYTTEMLREHGFINSLDDLDDLASLVGQEAPGLAGYQVGHLTDQRAREFMEYRLKEYGGNGVIVEVQAPAGTNGVYWGKSDMILARGQKMVIEDAWIDDTGVLRLRTTAQSDHVVTVVDDLSITLPDPTTFRTPSLLLDKPPPASTFLSTDQAVALSNFRGPQASRINAALQAGAEDSLDEVSGAILWNMDEAMLKSSVQGNWQTTGDFIYARGATTDRLFMGKLGTDIEDALDLVNDVSVLKGQEYIPNSFVSASFDESDATNWLARMQADGTGKGRPVIVEIETPQGTRSLMPSKPVNPELIYDRRTSFIVREARIDATGTVRVTLRAERKVLSVPPPPVQEAPVAAVTPTGSRVGLPSGRISPAKTISSKGKSFVKFGDVEPRGSSAAIKAEINDVLSQRIMRRVENDDVLREWLEKQVVNEGSRLQIKYDTYSSAYRRHGDIPLNVSDVEKYVRMEVNNSVHQWAMTSADSNPTSIAFQRRAQVVFDLSTDTIDLLRASERITSEVWNQSTALIDERQVFLDTFLQEMYANTQEVLGAQGIKSLKLARGMSIPNEILGARPLEGEAAREIALRPLSSYTSSGAVANKFGGGGWGTESSVVVKAEIPADMIIGTCRTGYGCLNEYEFVVAGVRGDQWVKWRGY